MNNFKENIDETISYLNKNEAVNSIHVDPYWPKWNSPWWRMLLLYEVGKADLIPKIAIDSMIESINNHYLKFFPFYESEIPIGKDPYRHIVCHCALGSAYQFLRSCYADIDSLITWIRPWFVKYQLPDGGLNCDEQAYTNSKKSSIVSSLPAFEAILNCAGKGLSKEEEEFLDRGAKYVINHRLVYRTNSEIMDASFLRLQFPRFYSYDILRGLNFLAKWRKVRDKDDADETIEFGFKLIKGKLSKGKLKVERSNFKNEDTLLLSKSGEWIWRKAITFPLLDDVSSIGKDSDFLSDIFARIK